jgi:hypothetical protein
LIDRIHDDFALHVTIRVGTLAQYTKNTHSSQLYDADFANDNDDDAARITAERIEKVIDSIGSLFSMRLYSEHCVFYIAPREIIFERTSHARLNIR